MAVKRMAARGAAKLGKRRAKRTPAGTAAMYGKALIGDDDARGELRSAFASARKAYSRTATGGRPDIVQLLRDRRASKEAGNSLDSLRNAARIASRRREKPERSKAPAVAAAAIAGAGAAVAIKSKRSAPQHGADGAHSTDGAPIAAA